MSFTAPSSGSSITLGDNITVSGSVTECRNSTSCSVAVVVVHDVRAVKVGSSGSSFSAIVQTVVNPNVVCDPNPAIICLRQSGPYRVSVWIANDTIANGTEGSIGASGHPTIPADATVSFFVASPATMSASLSPTTITLGDAVTLTGSVAKATPAVAAWAFDGAGTLSNGHCFYRSMTPTGGSFTWTLDRAITGRPGPWTVFVLSPGIDQIFRLSGDKTPTYANVDSIGADSSCSNASLLNKDGSQILATLKATTDSQRYDDEYRVFTLFVGDTFLRLDPLSVAFLNDTLTVSGRTSGNGSVLVSVAGSLFEKQQVASVSNGIFTTSFDTTVSNNTTWPWAPGKYTVRALGPEGKQDTQVVELVSKRPSEFKVDNLVVLFEDGTAMDGRAPAVGQKMAASAVLINKGEEAGNATLTFQLSGRTLCAPVTSLNGGQYATVTCNFTVNYTGTYTLQADGKSVTLNVRGPKLPEVAGEAKPIPSLAGGAQARLLFSGAVDQVVLQAKSPVASAEVIVQPLDERPEGTGAPPGTPFRYFRLAGVNLPDAAVGSMTVMFRVDGGWLAEKKLSPGTVRLYRLATAPAGAGGAGAAAGTQVWRVEGDITRLGTDGRADGSSDILYQAKVTAFGDFAVVGGSTEGAISAPGEAGPLAILTNIPVMAAIAAGAGFAVFAWRKGWLPFLKKKAPAAEAVPGVLTEGAAEALPRTYEDEVYSLFRSGQMGQAFRRIFDEVAGPLKAAVGAEGALSSGELLREAESKGLDPTLLTTLGQLFATCDAARFSGIPPTEEHLKWALRAARSVFARLSGGGALPASTGGGAAPEAAGPVPGADYAGEVPGAPQEPGLPPEGPEGGYEAADLPPDSEAPPGPEAPEEHKNGNGPRRRRRRRGGNGNGNGNGGHGGPGGNGNGNGNGHHGNGNGNGGGGRQASGRLVPLGSPVYSPYGGSGFIPAPPPATGGLVKTPPPLAAGPAMSAYASFQRGLVPSLGREPDPSMPLPPFLGKGGRPAEGGPVPPFIPRPTPPRPGPPGSNGNGHGTNGTDGHGTNGNNGANGHGTPGPAPAPPLTEQASRASPPRGGPSANAPVALDRATVAAMMAAEMRRRRRAAAPSRPIPGIGGRKTPTPDGSGDPVSASPSTPPPSLSSVPQRERRTRAGEKSEPAPYPSTQEGGSGRAPDGAPGSASSGKEE